MLVSTLVDGVHLRGERKLVCDLAGTSQSVPPHRSLRHPSNERLTLALLRELSVDQMVDDTLGAGGRAVSIRGASA